MDLTIDNVISTLTIVQDRTTARLKLAENQLQIWQTTDNYYCYLLRIYLNNNNVAGIRLLSLIEFKNGIDKYYRNQISIGEKTQIKQLVLTNILTETDYRMMLLISYTTARILRFDFDMNLLNSIKIGLRDASDVLALFNILVLLNQVVKSLINIKIGRNKLLFKKEMNLYLDTFLSIYYKYFDTNTKIRYITFKILRRLLVDGLDLIIYKCDLLNEFFQFNLNYFNLHMNTDLVFTKSLVKLYYNYIYYNLNSFILTRNSFDTLNSLIKFLGSNSKKISTLTSESEDKNLLEVISIKIMLIFKKLFHNQTIIVKSIDKQDIEASKLKIKSYLNDEFIVNLCELLLSEYLKLNNEDMFKWQNDPESFVIDEMNENYEYNIRLSTEKLFENIFQYNMELSLKFVLSKLLQFEINSPEAGNVDLLVKDSLLTLIQLGSRLISDVLDFDVFLVNTVFPILDCQQDIITNNKKILIRKCLMIINSWVSVKCSRENRCRIYEIIFQLMKLSNDKVIILTSILTLQNLVEDWDFIKTDFRKYSDLFINILLRLLSNGENSFELIESKMIILKCLNIILQKNGKLISATVLQMLVDEFPNIWQFFDDELIIKTILIRTLKHLIVCLQNSNLTNNITLEILQYCCNYDSKFYSVLSEDGFELWKVYMEYYRLDYLGSQKDLQIFEFFPLLDEPMMNTTEILPLILSIIEAYIILVPKEIFTTDAFIQLLKKYLIVMTGDLLCLRDDSLDIVLLILDTVLIKIDSLNESEKSVAFKFLFINDSDFTKRNDKSVILHMVNSVTNEDCSLITLNKMIPVVCRMFPLYYGLADFDNHNDVVKLPPLFLDKIIKNSENVFEARKRKIVNFGLINIIKNNEDWISLVELNSIFKQLLLFFEEINENEDGSCESYFKGFQFDDFDLMFSSKEDIKLQKIQMSAGDTNHRTINGELVQEEELDLSFEYNFEFQNYEKLVFNHDFVYFVNLKNYVKQVLINVGDVNGKLASADYNILQNLQREFK